MSDAEESTNTERLMAAQNARMLAEGHPEADPETPCPECGKHPLHIEVVTHVSGGGGLMTEQVGRQMIWLIPRIFLDGNGYRCEITLSCDRCGWEKELGEDDWEAGQ